MQRDKKLHIAAGFLLAVVAAAAAVQLGAPATLAALAGVAVAGVAGWAKEYVYDKRRTDVHTVDRKDLAATFYGGLVGGFLFALVTPHVTIPVS